MKIAIQRSELEPPKGSKLLPNHRFRFTLQSFLLITFSVVLSPGLKGLAAFIQPERAEQGMVVSAHPLATAAGVAMLEQGGNAVDAAVATAFAISVVEPFSAGIGGGGFLLFHRADTSEIETLDFRERAPLAATRDMYLDQNGEARSLDSLNGYRSVAVPGTVAGLATIHQHSGKLPWSTVIAPAIRLAQDGFIVGRKFVESAADRQELLLSHPGSREVFTRNGQPYQVGDRLRQLDLARTLQSIAEDPQNFYQGEIARAIAEDMAKNGGLITLEDLKTYQPIWREPLCGSFRVYRVCSMPPPSSGGVHLLQILNIIGDHDLAAMGWHSPDTLHFLIEAMKIAYADRSEYLGDPDFVDVPVSALTSRDYAEYRRQEIDSDRARTATEVKPIDRQTLGQFSRVESQDTTHLNVVDRDRNAISLTFTVNYRFGSGVVVPGTGILLNDEMDDFAIAPGVANVFGLVGTEANAIAPRKTPLSSMTPTIVTENNQLRLVAGAPGGSTIITTVLQILLNVLVYDMDVGAAVSAPRIHHQWLPEQLWVEPWGLDPATLEVLQQQGHTIQQRDPWGNGNAIFVREKILEGAADPRGEGTAQGY